MCKLKTQHKAHKKDTLIINTAKGESGVGESGKTISIQPSLEWEILQKYTI